MNGWKDSMGLAVPGDAVSGTNPDRDLQLSRHSSCCRVERHTHCGAWSSKGLRAKGPKGPLMLLGFT